MLLEDYMFKNSQVHFILFEREREPLTVSSENLLLLKLATTLALCNAKGQMLMSD